MRRNTQPSSVESSINDESQGYDDMQLERKPQNLRSISPEDGNYYGNGAEGIDIQDEQEAEENTY